MTESVNNPAHYGGADNIYEHRKVARALGWSYAIASATKYLWRAGKKDPKKHIEDLKKAIFWIQDEINAIEETQRVRVVRSFASPPPAPELRDPDPESIPASTPEDPVPFSMPIPAPMPEDPTFLSPADEWSNDRWLRAPSDMDETRHLGHPI